jgi:hypothetical protein
VAVPRWPRKRPIHVDASAVDDDGEVTVDIDEPIAGDDVGRRIGVVPGSYALLRD